MNEVDFLKENRGDGRKEGMQFISAFFLLFASSIPATAASIEKTLSVTTKTEFRCDVEWQMFPGKVAPGTKDNFTSGAIVLVEFDKPLAVGGAAVYGLGAESGSGSASELKVGGNVVLLRKEENGLAMKLSYGVLTQEHPLYNVTTDLSKAILSFGAKIAKVGFLIVNGRDPSHSVFQRAPIDADYGQASYLKPMGARCKKTESKQEIHPFQLD